MRIREKYVQRKFLHFPLEERRGERDDTPDLNKKDTNRQEKKWYHEERKNGEVVLKKGKENKMKKE